MINSLPIKQLDSLLSVTDCFIANSANCSAFLFDNLENLNWVGFYFLKDENLILGPFKGKPACVILQKGKGVCQKAVDMKETISIADVHSFSGHIACDAESKSELVVPIFFENEIIGVLDIDSPIENRFCQVDIDFFESAVQIFVKNTNLNRIKSYYINS